MKKIVTASLQFVLVHLAAWWPGTRKQEVVRQYKAMAAAYPLVVADLARRGMAFDNTFDPQNSRLSDYNQGRRSFWLETAALIGIAPDDLQTLRNLQQETEHDPES